MKLFLVFLLVACCQAIELFDTSSYELEKEVELKNLVKVAEEEILKMLVKEYPDKDQKMLKELSHQIALLVKSEIDEAFELINHGSKLAIKLTNNMRENLRKAATDMLHGLETVPESVEKFLRDFTRDIEEMEQQGVLNIYLDRIFDHITERVAFKLEYGLVERRDIWDQLNDTLHRVIGHLSGKFSDLKDFFQKSIKVGSEKLQPHLINMKKLAKDLLANLNLVSKNVAQQALEFFKPFAKQLGDLWVKLVKKIDEQFHLKEPIPTPASW